MTFSKPSTRERWVSREFRIYVTERTCAHCHAVPSDPCHTVSRKVAAGSDATCINLCRKCHRIFDDWGKAKIEKLRTEWNLVLWEIQEGLWAGFLLTHGLDCPDLTTQQIFEVILTNAGLSQPAGSRRKNRPVPF